MVNETIWWLSEKLPEIRMVPFSSGSDCGSSCVGSLQLCNDCFSRGRLKSLAELKTIRNETVSELFSVSLVRALAVADFSPVRVKSWFLCFCLCPQ